jgi:purine-binding chemotaxis protein CheW|tara:strand:+ start:375 stop:890 length:516 start_codon:yes stop_codon:yes gene_type:complete
MTQVVSSMENIPASKVMRALTLELGDEVFAIEATSVREIQDIVPVTEVPNAQQFVGGLINVRGRVVPLADLRVKFGMERRPPDADTRIVVFEITLDIEPIIVGILADRVHTVTDIAIADVEPPPNVGMRWRPEFVRGIAQHNGKFIIIPNLGAIFSSTSTQPKELETEGRN